MIRRLMMFNYKAGIRIIFSGDFIRSRDFGGVKKICPFAPAVPMLPEHA
jgi:hypothetical protein